MKNKKRHVLILGGSSDIGIEVVKNFLKLKWTVTAHFFKNKKKLKIIKKDSKNLNIVECNFSNYNNLNVEKLVVKKFSGKYDSIINLIGYIDNKSFEGGKGKNTQLILGKNLFTFWCTLAMLSLVFRSKIFEKYIYYHLKIVICDPYFFLQGA